MPDQEFEALTSSIYAGLFNWEGYSLRQIRAMPFLKLQDRERQLYYTLNAPPTTASSSDSITNIVLIHGLGSSSSYYAPVIPKLVDAGYSCLALDSHGAYITY